MKREEVLAVIYPRSEGVRGRRFTQDTAVIPDVWILFGTSPDLKKPVELLLTPHANSDVPTLVQALRPRLARERGVTAEAGSILTVYNESHVLVEISYRELIRAVLPLSWWWAENVAQWWRRNSKEGRLERRVFDRLAREPDFIELMIVPGWQAGSGKYPDGVLDLVRVAGVIALGRPMPDRQHVDDYALREYLEQLVDKFYELAADLDAATLPASPPLWSVFCNRRASGAIAQSRLAVKADAAVRLFEISCKGLVWAIVDSGIDATHPAFAMQAPTDPRTTGKPPGVACGAPPAGADAPAQQKRSRAPCEHMRSSRILRTYDFTRLRPLLSSNFIETGDTPSVFSQLDDEQQRDIRRDLQRRLITGQPLDWKLLDPLLEMPHHCDCYVPPVNEHGTHIAGILAADWRRPPEGAAAPARDSAAALPPRSLIGVCPDLELYDLRVFDKDGSGDEFTILAALQFVRYLNQSKDRMVVHGVNLSFSLPHAVDSFACGSTPVCEECERLVGSGVVVVAAAGNRGYRNDGVESFEEYRNISITDPGNAEGVITVGATHRFMPHKYGVSYFSSRGPTGDGRLKPDLVAPGEKIESVTPRGRWATLDGTSMAAPHVSGAAALLIARHRELAGRPARIKEILCKTATDLRRERAFQGAGMVDVLRALQSV